MATAQLVLAKGEGDEVLDLPFESEISETWPDLSEYGNDGDGSTTSVTAGKVGNAAYFGGVPLYTHYIGLGDDPSLKLDTSDFTIAAWIKFLGIYNPGSNNQATIFFDAGGDEGNNFNQMVWAGIRKIGSSHRLKLGFYGPKYDSPVTITPHEWTHIAVTFHRGSTMAEFYKNGDFVTDVFMNGVPNFYGWTGALVGRAWWGDVANCYFSGSLDELHVYKRRLSGDEVRALAYKHDPSEDPCETYLEGSWVQCRGYQWIEAAGWYGWVNVKYDDDAVNFFRSGHSVEFEWIFPIDPEEEHWVTLGVSNFIDPKPNHADDSSPWSGAYDFGVDEKQPEDWVKDVDYYTYFTIDPPVSGNLSIEIELNKDILFIPTPQAGCKLKNVPVGAFVDWRDANRENLGYEHQSWVGSWAGSSTASMSTTTLEAPKVQDYNDFITVDLLSRKEMLALQANYDLNITGVEMFNAETGETAWVYLIHDESVEQGMQRLQEFGVKDFPGFRVYAIKLIQTPSAILEESGVLSAGRVHPNNPEWEGSPQEN